MSTERSNDNLEQVAGPARARLGDLTRAERAEADQAARQDEIRGRQPGEHVQKDARDARDDFTT
ncbi:MULTISPECIES: general stress protein CsbD [Micromonospora]|uniref:General stress protein CsbD n=1 Tax=Micromonospora solifontis TaxID=2487138 RepID=A0ABX9WE37_9ACTN|nr:MULTISPECIES: general stress protein CsbD [Micromonospora]NES14207.1 general stress protein CsbD [Micromonospora sp. PPF5-17B]NES37643.1 general stress protein CsbD [Micromonospora solifontis]NES55844.1 general stress protein CsbD [Micromonospora sp. PPF5-6]RNL98088.1 general stress protein CsbD [Micromonospora solifontis]